MPEGIGGETFRAMSKHVPPPPGAMPVVRWGTEEGLREISGGAATFTLTRRTFFQYYRSVDHLLDTFFQYFARPCALAKPSARRATLLYATTWATSSRASTAPRMAPRRSPPSTWK